MQVAVFRHKLAALSAFILFSITLTDCRAMDVKLKTIAIDGGVFVVVPARFLVSQSDPVGDFLIYSINSSKNKEILKIYIGNHPEKINLAPSKALRINNLAASFYQRECGVGKFCGDVVVKIIEGNGWPMYAHFFYNELSAADKDVAENIINSFGFIK